MASDTDDAQTQSGRLIQRLDKTTGLWIIVGIGFSKQVEFVIATVLPHWVTVTAGGLDVTVGALYGALWTGTLTLIVLLKTLDT